ncbi:hypothetical protein Sd1_gp26 [Shigella phage Sd1]|uniref:Uncharacterized protein n=1 Tax=Shigella phage Sd1 TaxID=2024313 RepID=A0A291AYI9_9CAUD|nr:membrane associated protein [Shigella phage Sd1]ATE86092.1 hypothetical protein Sd1_gp26 [Shigella phage Sd1]
MSYGAMIDVNGNPFITPNSTPFALYKKTTHSGSGGMTGSVYIPVPNDIPCMVFAKTTETNTGTGIAAYRFTSGPNSGNVYFTAQNSSGENFTATVYIFGIFTQTLPDWGMAIWDAAGKLILTNETKVLSDLRTIGTPGQAGGGINIDTESSLSGSWAVSPRRLGAIISEQIVGGIPQRYTIDLYTTANYNGSRTRIRAAGYNTVPGSQTGSINTGVTAVAINTSNYD